MNNPHPKKLTPKRFFKKRAFVIAALVVLVLGGAFTAQAFYYQNRILPHTTVAGVVVGGMKLAEAEGAVQARTSAFATSTTSFTYKTSEWKLANKDLGLTTDATQVVQQAYTEDKTGGLAGRLALQIKSWFISRTKMVTVQPLSKLATQLLQDKIVKSIMTPYQETGLEFTSGSVTVRPGVTGTALDSPSLLAGLSAILNTGSQRVPLVLKQVKPELTVAQVELTHQQAEAILMSGWTVQLGTTAVMLPAKTISSWLDTQIARDGTGRATGLTLILKPDVVETYVKAQAKTLDVAPINAILTVSNGALSVAQDGKNGFAVHQPETVAAIHTSLLVTPPVRTITGVADVAQPDVRADTIATLGLTAKIGTATTDYTGSPVNRTHNIATGTAKLSGQLVKDGETFSTTGTLGNIDESTGYLPELVILNNQTLPEFGGGLCQVSTTFFRAVLNAGLPVVTRTNHSYRVGYYERGVGPGLDATVYDPNPDFKWKNDTGHAVYVIGTIKDKTVTFDLYGTSDGRTAAIDGPHTLSTTVAPGGAQYVDTDTLAKGATKLIDPAIPGATTTATYTVTRGGVVINQQTFNSTYKAMPAQYLRGTKDVPVVSPSPSATPSATPSPSPSATSSETPSPSPSA